MILGNRVDGVCVGATVLHGTNTGVTTLVVVAHAQDARWELQRRQADDNILFDRTRALVDEKSSSLLELESMLAVTKQDKSLQGKELKRLQQARKHIHNELTVAGETLNKHENGMQLAIEERETILEEQRSIKGQLQILDEQLAGDGSAESRSSETTKYSTNEKNDVERAFDELMTG